MNTNIQTVD